MGAERPNISLCMIVKDEERTLARCLQSVRDVVSETIVVDTGSRDKTVKIASEQGARVFHHPWNDHFAEARNFSLRQAQGDWILVLDADEVLAPRDLELFAELTRDPAICTEFVQRHYIDDQSALGFVTARGEYPEIEAPYAGYFESACVRLFPNRSGIEFRGRVHELVEHALVESDIHAIKRTEARIHHFGHADIERWESSKGELYERICELQVAETPSNWRNFLALGLAKRRRCKFTEAAQALSCALDLNPRSVEAAVNLGQVLWELGRTPEALAVLRQALNYAPNSVEALANLGVIHLRHAEFHKAEQAFRLALAIEPRSSQVICNLAETLGYQGRAAEAMAAYRHAIEVLPRCVPALIELGAMQFNRGEFREAEALLRKALELKPGADRARAHLASVLESTGRDAEASALRVEYGSADRLGPISL